MDAETDAMVDGTKLLRWVQSSFLVMVAIMGEMSDSLSIELCVINENPPF